MADQPDPPDKWRVYEGDDTPDPEPEAAPGQPPPVVPYSPPPADVPYGGARPYNPVVTRSTSSSFAPKLVLLIVGIAVLGVGVAVAVAIFAVGDGIGGLGGIDAKSSDDFAEMVDELEQEKGTTEVTWVGLYTDYIIVDVPYTDNPSDDREVSYTWRGDDFEEWSKGTSTDPRFDLTEIDPAVIDGMCDAVLAEADGATPDDCYVFISKPAAGSNIWFRTSATDEFGKSVWVNYDKDGREVERGHS